MLVLILRSQANAFAPNWGQTIFQSASEMVHNAMLRERVAELQSTVGAEKQWWADKKASIKSEFMKELNNDSATKTGKVNTQRRGSEDDAVLVEAGGPDDAAKKKAKSKK